MRDIKFRVWDTERKRMVENPFLFEEHHWSDEKRINRRSHRYYEDKYDWREGIPYECEVMQFIGLEDKNKTEIYEGDIVRDGWYEGVVGVVKFDGGSFDLGFGYPENLATQARDCMVLGNIYQHPELLKLVE